MLNTHYDTPAGIFTAVIPGDLTSTTASQLGPEIKAQLDHLPTPGWRLFRLELAGAKMVDSMGVNLIVSCLKTAEQRGAKMQIVCANANVHRTFMFTRLDKRIELIKI